MKKSVTIGIVIVVVLLILFAVSPIGRGVMEDISMKISGFASKSDTSRSCVDTDSGLDYFTKGEVTYIFDNGGKKKVSEDYCFNKSPFYKNSRALREYGCDELNQLTARTRFCADGCVDGACL